MSVEAALLRAFDDCTDNTNGPPQVSGQLITRRAEEMAGRADREPISSVAGTAPAAPAAASI